MDWGYDFIQWLQQFSPALDLPFKAISTLGAEQAFLLLLPLVYWCVDKRWGVRLSVLLMLSSSLNYALKTVLDQPRPSLDHVEILAEETTPGFPSHHSQVSVCVYGFLAAQVRKPWAWVTAGLLAVGVGLSRVYLGVHFPRDVLGGWLIGIAILGLYLWFLPGAERRIRAWSWSRKLALAVALPLALFLFSPDKNSAQLLGIFVGLVIGVLVEFRRVRFSAQGPLRQRTLRFVIGGAILIALWLGTKVLSPSMPVELYSQAPETAALVWRIIRYTLVGGWATLGAPWLFVRFGLAPTESEA